jgi:hypothetical protein
MFFENGIRGGMSGVTKRLCQANNQYMKDFDTKKEKIFLTYLDGKLIKVYLHKNLIYCYI